MNSNTTPQVRADVTGKLVTRHVLVTRPDSKTSSKIPSLRAGGNPAPVIQSALSKHMPPQDLQRVLQSSSPRQQAAIRDAIVRSNEEAAPLIAAAVRKGHNVGIVSSLATVYERELFTDRAPHGEARFQAFMGAIRDASLIGGCGSKTDRLAEELPAVQENVKKYVYLSASVNQPLNKEIADLALRSDHDFEDVLNEMVNQQSVDAGRVRAALEGN